MNKRTFKTIGIIGRLRSAESTQTVIDLQKYLAAKQYNIVIEQETASLLDDNSYPVYPREEIGNHCDLAIVVGGDGSILNAASAIVDSQTPVLGINRGRLGFLTDIHPEDLADGVGSVLNGHYHEETRFLLNAEIHHEGECIHSDTALNDVVLLPGEYAHMIEFEIYVNQQLVCSQRADGQIIATPTGSTAYSLSGGGPILHPKLKAMVLVPMFSHTLSARPIVTSADDKIEIVIGTDNETSPHISCDGKALVQIAPGDKLIVYKKAKELILLHPTNYNYFATLRSKLHWQKKL